MVSRGLFETVGNRRIRLITDGPVMIVDNLQIGEEAITNKNREIVDWNVVLLILSSGGN